MKTVAATAALALGLAFAVNACGGGGSSDDVKASLKEFSVTLDSRQHKAGSISIKVDNTGSIKHEFIIMRAKDAAALPLDAQGGVDEEKVAEADKPGEIAEFAQGTSKTKKFNLPAGDYVMFCNLVNEKSGTPPVVHFKLGMHETFTAT